MLVRESGHTVVHTSPVAITSGAQYWTEIRAALLAAGWSEISSNVLRSLRTPQGLQMVVAYVSASGHNMYFQVKSPDLRDTSLRNMRMYSGTPSVCDRFRVIANGYQYFTYNDNGQEGYIGAVVSGGVPWIPPFLEAPRIVSVDNNSPIEITVDRDHEMLSGQIAFIDGITSYSGMVGYCTIQIIDSRRIRLGGSTGSGSYTTDTCMISVPGRYISRMIWAQSMQGVTVFSTDRAPTLRQTVTQAPAGGWYADDGTTQQVIMINQFNWCLQNNSSSADTIAGMKMFLRFPYGKNFYGGAYPASEAWFHVGESSVMSPTVLVGQLWDAFLVNAPNTTDRVVTLGGREWKPYTVNSSPDGCLVVRSGN